MTPDHVSSLVKEQIASFQDVRAKARIEEFLISPRPVEGGWDYGKPGEAFTCWVFLEHRDSGTGIAYCPEGFGPRCPWGLMNISGEHAYRIGMDCQWYPTLEGAFVESWAGEELSTGR